MDTSHSPAVAILTVKGVASYQRDCFRDSIDSCCAEWCTKMSVSEGALSAATANDSIIGVKEEEPYVGFEAIVRYKLVVAYRRRLRWQNGDRC